MIPDHSSMKVKEVDRTANIAWSPQTQVPIYLARWDEDGVWYNAVIENIAEDGRIEVTFTDYGNSAIVSREDIVSHAGDIPTDQTEMIDECVRIDKFPGEDLVSHAKDIPADKTEIIDETDYCP